MVYLAWESVLNRHVAVKLFPRNSLVDPHAREHWLAEARALSRVPHDHVVAIHRVDETEDWLALVIEYVAGGTLKDRLTEPLPTRDAARLTETIARAVGYFHTRGVCHLDLKPSNILLDGEPGAPWDAVSPRISDFGIARLEGEPGATETGANGPKGTPSYMAPEQVAARPGTIGPAADIHALGALLYHLLTGRPPFQGASSEETLDQVRHQDPVPPRRLNGRIPRDLETICLTCLEKDPGRRYRSAEALAGDLRLWLEGRPIEARRISPMGLAWRWCRRHPAIAGLLLTLGLTLATGIVGLLVLLNQVEAERLREVKARRNAEAYQQFSVTAAEKLARLLKDSGRNTVMPEEMKTTLLDLWDSAGELRNRGIAPSRTLVRLEQKIAGALVFSDRALEARERLERAIADIRQELAKHPEDRATMDLLRDLLVEQGRVDEYLGRLEDARDCYEGVATLQPASEPGSRADADRLYPLITRLQVLANALGLRGRTGEQERSYRAIHRLLRDLLGSDTPSSTDARAPGLEALEALLRREGVRAMATHEDRGPRRWLVDFVAQWLAYSDEIASPIRSSVVAAEFDRDPDSGAIAFLAAIRRQCSNLGLPDYVVPTTIRHVADDAAERAGEQRGLGRQDLARATAARLLAIARRAVRDYPDSASSHAALSQAYNQIKKNAYRDRDDRAIESAIRQSIEAAHRALALDPDDPAMRRHFDKLNERLDEINAERDAGGPRPK